MKSSAQPPITVDEFLALAQGQERGCFELSGGGIVMQHAGRAAHWETKVAMPRIVSEGSLALDPPGLTIAVSEPFSGWHATP